MVQETRNRLPPGKGMWQWKSWKRGKVLDAGWDVFFSQRGLAKARQETSRTAGLGWALSVVSDVASHLRFFVPIPPQLSC